VRNLHERQLNVEKEIAISILRLTRQGPVSQEMINKQAKVPSRAAEKLLRKLQNDGLIYVDKSFVGADTIQRLKLAVYALKLGGDLERVTSFLKWQEFESMAAIAFERNGYHVWKNVRFRHGGRRWEIDIVGCRQPLVICVDCKHWQHRLHPSTQRKVIEEQVERTFALAEFLPALAGKIECGSWVNARLIPTVLTLVIGQAKFYDKVPMVPILQLQDFLEKLPAYADTLKSFRRV
jgi:Holliday junction resolvase-like predicted endonuclease